MNVWETEWRIALLMLRCKGLTLRKPPKKLESIVSKIYLSIIQLARSVLHVQEGLSGVMALTANG